ncbi:uncharacterized protein Dmoj_GI18511 [Drosophila mojavensis]|uniref:Uncharacterized protein n=1 Tax=Drosophila mojavensis TaxID=7230 RepID=B4KS63_DROMO|nr:uncharacterized protein Dmoj_GI18511 [Drosophila mojavensis]
MQNRQLTKSDFYQSRTERNDRDSSSMGNADEALEMLTSRRAKLRDWIQRAWTHYNQNQIDGFVLLLENSITRGLRGYPGYEEDLLRTHAMLTAHYFRMACNEVGQRSCDWQEKVLDQLQIIDAMNMESNEIPYLLCRGFALLLVDGCLPEAETLFVSALRQSPYNVPALLGLGCLAYNRQEYRAALGYFKSVLSHHPDGPADVRMGIGHCFLKMGDLDRARRAFELAVESNERCINALIGFAQLKLNERQREANMDATKLLCTVFELNNRHPVVLTWLSCHLYYTRNYEKLRTAAGNAFLITDDPDLKAQNCYHIARSFHATKDYDRAFDFYGKAVKYQPNFSPPHLGVAQIYVRRGQLYLAELSLRTLLKLMPENKEALRMLGAIYTQSAEPTKLDRAVQLFQSALDHGGREDCDTWLALGEAYERKQQWQPAIDAYEEAISIYQRTHGQDKDIPLPWLNNLAALQQHAGLPEAALITLDKAIRELPKNPNSEHSESNLLTVRFNRARVLEDLGLVIQAENSYKQLIIEYPNYYDSYLRLGVMANKCNKAVMAVHYFSAVLRLEADHIVARTFLGNLYARHGALSQAMCSYSLIMRRQANAAVSSTLVAVGNVCLLKGTRATANDETDMALQYKQNALQLFCKALEQNKRNLWAANGLGVAMCHLSHLTAAETIYKQVVESSSLCSNAILNLAHVAMDLKHYSDSVEIYRKCLKDVLPANSVKEMQMIASALYQSEQFDEAKLILCQARRAAPHDPNIIFNLGLVIKQAIRSTFDTIQTDLTELQKAEQNISIALRFFQYLSQGKQEFKSARKQSKKCTKLQQRIVEQLQNLREQEELSKKQERRKAKKNKEKETEKEGHNEEPRRIHEETPTQVDEPNENPTVDNEYSKKRRSKKRRNSSRDVDEVQNLELEKSKSKKKYRKKENQQEIREIPSDVDVEKRVGPVKLSERDRILEKDQSTKRKEEKANDANNLQSENKTSGETLQTYSNKSIAKDELEQKGKEESLDKKSRKSKRKEKHNDKQDDGVKKKSETVHDPAQVEKNPLQLEIDSLNSIEASMEAPKPDRVVASSRETMKKHSNNAMDMAEFKKEEKEESLDKKSRKAKRKEKQKQVEGEENKKAVTVEDPAVVGKSQLQLFNSKVASMESPKPESLGALSGKTLKNHSNKAMNNTELEQEGQDDKKIESEESKSLEIVHRLTQNNEKQLQVNSIDAVLEASQPENIDALSGEALKKDEHQDKRQTTEQKLIDKKIDEYRKPEKVRGHVQVEKLLQPNTDILKSMPESKPHNSDTSSEETLKRHSSKSMMKDKHEKERKEETHDRKRSRKHKHTQDKKIDYEQSRKPDKGRDPTLVEKKLLQPEADVLKSTADLTKAQKCENLDTSKGEALKTHSSKSMMKDVHHKERKEQTQDRGETREQKPIDNKVESQENKSPEKARGLAHVDKKLQPETDLFKSMAEPRLQDLDASSGETLKSLQISP